MKENKTSSPKGKWIVILVLSVGIGTFVSNDVLAKLEVNVWFARCAGALVAVIIALLLDYLFTRKAKKNQ